MEHGWGARLLLAAASLLTNTLAADLAGRLTARVPPTPLLIGVESPSSADADAGIGAAFGRDSEVPARWDRARGSTASKAIESVNEDALAVVVGVSVLKELERLSDRGGAASAARCAALAAPGPESYTASPDRTPFIPSGTASLDTAC